MAEQELGLDGLEPVKTPQYYNLPQPKFGITADTTDEELKKLAGQICYRAGIAMNAFVESALENQRQLARLEKEVQALRNQFKALGQSPHLQHVERR